MAKIEVFSGPVCSYCDQAKRLLALLNLDFIDYDIAEPVHLKEYANRLPRSKSIPQIFVDGQHIGNEEDLKIIAQDGRLLKMLGKTSF